MAVDTVTAEVPSQNVNGYSVDNGKFRPTAFSTYKLEFGPKSQRKRSPYVKRCELQLSGGEMVRESKYAEDFKPHSYYKPNEAIRPVNEIPRMAGVMESNTTSKDAFTVKPVTRRILRPKVPYQPPDGKMDCSTSYGSSFPAHTGHCKLPPIIPKSLMESSSSKPLMATTENREQFKAYTCGGRQASFKPNFEYSRPLEPFHGVSAYKEEYTPRYSERVQKFCPKGNLGPDGEYFGAPASPPPAMMMKQQKPLCPIVPRDQNFQDNADVNAEYNPEN